MYELWLMVNILWETAITVWPLLALLLATWLVLMVLARRRLRTGWPIALRVGAVGALLAFLLLPAVTSSTLAKLSYWVDWLALAGMAAGFGTAAALFALPLAGLLRAVAAPKYRA